MTLFHSQCIVDKSRVENALNIVRLKHVLSPLPANSTEEQVARDIEEGDWALSYIIPSIPQDIWVKVAKCTHILSNQYIYYCLSTMHMIGFQLE